jgi:hypothetical protein
MKLLSPELWLEQAKADAAASKVKTGLAECHRRYLLQQAYEKGVKALGLACLTRDQLAKGQFASALGDCFLHHHTPMTVFTTKDDDEWEEELRRAYKGAWQALLKELKALRNQVALRMGQGADKKLVDAWKRVDATRPRKAVDAVSYRYPFVDQKLHPDGVAPKSWQGWDAYQGPEGTVREAIAELLKRAGGQLTIWQRG